MWQHALLAFSIGAILAPFSYYAGLGARLLRLPQITGYLVSGIVCGPYLLGILSHESVTDLNIIEGVCLSIIGLAAGSELDWPSLARSRKQVLGITAAVCITSWIASYAALDWLGGAVPVLPGLGGGHTLAVATLGATLMMTRSPASAIAVLKEVDGKGPFCSLVMAVVVVKDVVVITAFAFNMEIIRMVILPAGAGAPASPVALLLPVISVALSMAVGAFGGLLLGAVLRTLPAGGGFAPGGVAGIMRSATGALPTSQPTTPLGAGAEPHGTSRPRAIALLVVSSAVFGCAHYFEAEPLLACVTMGMVVVNRRGPNAEREKEELVTTVTHVMGLTNVAFFGLAGASLKLSALHSLLWPSLLVVAVRMVGIWVGAWAGCAATATVPEYRRLFWASMVTQAGVAMGLARLAGTRFPDWGPSFQTFMMAIILINLLIGPPLFRWALIRVGEVRGTGLIGGAGGMVATLAVVHSMGNGPGVEGRSKGSTAGEGPGLVGSEIGGQVEDSHTQ